MSLGLLYKISTRGAGTEESSQLLFSGSRIPSDTFQAMSLADNVLREAEMAAARLREQTISTLETQRRQAYLQGIGQGRTQGMVSVLGTLEVERRLRELLSHRMADIIEHCLRSILGELGAPEVLRQRILHLLKTAGMSLPITNSEPSSAGDAKLGVVTLYVGAEQFSMAQQILSELAQNHPGQFAGLNLVLDEKRPADALLLETRLCFIDSDLTLTLKETRSLVEQALSHAMHTLGETQ